MKSKHIRETYFDVFIASTSMLDFIKRLYRPLYRFQRGLISNSLRRCSYLLVKLETSMGKLSSLIFTIYKNESQHLCL